MCICYESLRIAQFASLLSKVDFEAVAFLGTVRLLFFKQYRTARSLLPYKGRTAHPMLTMFLLYKLVTAMPAKDVMRTGQLKRMTFFAVVKLC